MKTIPESIKSDWRSLIASLTPSKPSFIVTQYDEPIDDTEYATEEEADAVAEKLRENSTRPHSYGVAPASIQLTIGYSPDDESWNYQTGDNSFTGGAYGHSFWGVAYLVHGQDVEDVLAEIVDEIESQIADT